MDTDGRRHPPRLDDVARLVGTVLGVPAEAVLPTDRLRHELPLDELSLSQLVVALRDLNPWFELPDQLEVGDVTVADLHHFCCVMGPGHLEQAVAEP